LAYNNSIIAQKLIGQEELAALTGSGDSAVKVTAKL